MLSFLSAHLASTSEKADGKKTTQTRRTILLYTYPFTQVHLTRQKNLIRLIQIIEKEKIDGALWNAEQWMAGQQH